MNSVVISVRKHGKHGPSILHVSRQDTKSLLENSIIEEMKERTPDLLDVIATVSVPVVKEKGNQVPTVCVSYAVMMHAWWRELSLVQKVMIFILGIGHSTSTVNVCLLILLHSRVTVDSDDFSLPSQ